VGVHVPQRRNQILPAPVDAPHIAREHRAGGSNRSNAPVFDDDCLRRYDRASAYIHHCHINDCECTARADGGCAFDRPENAGGEHRGRNRDRDE
jgi:hypothetical protein